MESVTEIVTFTQAEQRAPLGYLPCENLFQGIWIARHDKTPFDAKSKNIKELIIIEKYYHYPLNELKVTFLCAMLRKKSLMNKFYRTNETELTLILDY